MATYTIKFTDSFGKTRDHEKKIGKNTYTTFRTKSKAYAQRVCREINNNTNDCANARVVEWL